LKIENCEAKRSPSQTEKLKISCSGCCDPKYNCGYSQDLHLPSCQDVIKYFS